MVFSTSPSLEELVVFRVCVDLETLGAVAGYRLDRNRVPPRCPAVRVRNVGVMQLLTPRITPRDMCRSRFRRDA